MGKRGIPLDGCPEEEISHLQAEDPRPVKGIWWGRVKRLLRELGDCLSHDSKPVGEHRVMSRRPFRFLARHSTFLGRVTATGKKNVCLSWRLQQGNLVPSVVLLGLGLVDQAGVGS